MTPFDKLDNNQFKKVRGRARLASARAQRSPPRQERNGGNYGAGTQEVQRQNYVMRKEVRAAL